MRASSGALLALSLAACAGEPAGDGSCASDADCGAGRVCAGGTCAAAC